MLWILLESSDNLIVLDEAYRTSHAFLLTPGCSWLYWNSVWVTRLSIGGDLVELRTRSEIITGMYLEAPSSLDSSGEMGAAFLALCFLLKCLETVELLHTVSQTPF